MKRFLFSFSLLVMLSLVWAACADSSDRSFDDGASPADRADGLSQSEIEKGIGPIEKVELSAVIDTALVSQGEAIFAVKCAACHKLTERYVGPPLGQVLDIRTPEFIMNMMLNPDEMARQHPEVQALLGQYFVPMPNQNLTEADARAVLEFLRDAYMGTSEVTP